MVNFMFSKDYKKLKLVAWFMWLNASIFYSYQYILRVMPNIIFEDVINAFNIDVVKFSQFSGIYYIGYSLAHLPLGILLDRIGPKKVMSICIILTLIGLLPLTYSDNFLFCILGRLLIGIGSSAAILGTFKIIRICFEEKRFTRMLSISVTIGLLGAIYGGAPVKLMLNEFGLETVINIFALIGLCLALITYLIVPNIQTANKSSIINDLTQVLTNKKVMLICIFAGLMVGPLEGFADVWGTAFLKTVYNFDEITSSSLPSLIFLGMCFGAPVISLIAEKSGQYLYTIIGSGILMALSFILLIAGINIHMITISFIIVGICSAYQIIAIYLASTYVKENIVALTTAMANMIIMIFGYGFHTIIGLIIDYSGGKNNTEAFINGIAIIPIAMVISCIGYGIYKYKGIFYEKNY